MQKFMALLNKKNFYLKKSLTTVLHQAIQFINEKGSFSFSTLPVADLDIQLREGGGGGGFVLLALPAFLPSVISSSNSFTPCTCSLD